MESVITQIVFIPFRLSFLHIRLHFACCHNSARVLFSSCFISRFRASHKLSGTMKNAMTSCFSFFFFDCLVLLFAFCNFWTVNINTVVMIWFFFSYSFLCSGFSSFNPTGARWINVSFVRSVSTVASVLDKAQHGQHLYPLLLLSSCVFLLSVLI